MTASPGLTITRVFDAPRELVFRAWTEPARFAQWFGGAEATIPLETVAMDVRPGGAWRATMFAGPERVEIRWQGVFIEVVPPERLVLTLSDQGGDEAEVVTVTFADLGGRTEMVMEQSGGHLSPEEYARAGQGWGSFFDALAEQLARETSGAGPATAGTRLDAYTTVRDGQLVMERVFDAPRELVFQAWTETRHLAQWWGPTGWTLPVSTLDLRPGGVWHYCMRGPGGEQSWGKAVYHEVVPPKRLVYTDAFSNEAGDVVEGMPQMTVTVEFAEQAGQTRVTSRTQFASAADLDKLLGMGAVAGMNETFNRLEGYLAERAR